MRIAVRIRFRSQGSSWPLREGDVLEIRQDLDEIAEIPAEVVLELLGHHLRAIELQRVMMLFVKSPPTPRKPLTPEMIALQQKRAAERRSRRRA